MTPPVDLLGADQHLVAKRRRVERAQFREHGADQILVERSLVAPGIALPAFRRAVRCR
jgi:hypothetical protein